MQFPYHQFIVFSFTLGLFSFLGCDLLGLTDPEEEGEEQTIEYKSNTVVLEGINTLALQDTSGGVYTFDKDQLSTADIQIRAGQVLLVEDHSLVRIMSVEETALGIDAVTQPAVLTDAIQNGTLNFQKEIGFSADGVADLVIDGNHSVSPKISSTGSINYETTVNGTKVNMKLTPSGDKAEVELKVEITDKVVLLGTGSITKFNVDHTLDIISGRTTNWQYNSSDYKAEMDIQLAGALAGPTDVALRLPQSLEIKIPIPIPGVPIPVHIGVGFKLVANIDMPEVYQASSQLTTKMSYSGSQGFKYQGTSLDYSGNVGSVEFGQYTHTSAALPGYQMVVTFGPVPTFGLYIFGSQVAYVDARFIVAQQFFVTPTLDVRVCREAAVSLAITGGYTLGMFGLTIASGQHNFYENYAEERSDTCEAGSSIQDEIHSYFSDDVASL